MIQNTKYRRYPSEEIIEDSEYPDSTTPVVRYRGDRGGADLTFDWRYFKKPFVTNDEPYANDFDRFMLFAGSNLRDFNDFQAEIEITLGREGTKIAFNESKPVYIPSGLVHGPVNFKSVGQPIAYMNFYLSPEFSKTWTGSDYGKYIVKPRVNSLSWELKTIANGHPFAEQTTPIHQIVYMGKDLGDEGANFSFFYYAHRYAYFMTEPAHTHEKDMWIINLNGDTANMENLNAELEMWWGEEKQNIWLDSVSVAYVVPGLIHREINFRKVEKPFIQIHAYNSPSPEIGRTNMEKEARI